MRPGTSLATKTEALTCRALSSILKASPMHRAVEEAAAGPGAVTAAGRDPRVAHGILWYCTVGTTLGGKAPRGKLVLKSPELRDRKSVV